MYKLQTKNGTTPPKYIHNNIDLAIAEAKRLAELHNTDVEILKIIGKVSRKEVPVTKTVLAIDFFKDELPF